MPRAQYGETNGRAKLTDAEADLIRTLHGQKIPAGTKRFWTTARLAEKFEVSKSTVQKIVGGTRRP